MATPALLLAAALALATAPDACPDDGAATVRQRVLAEINRDRARAGLHPLRFDPAVCRVAQERAEELAAAGSVRLSSESVAGTSRRLLRHGYEAHRWEQRALMGDGDPFTTWRDRREDEYREAAFGDSQHLGVGVARGGDRLFYSLLFTLPKREYLRRETAPLVDLEAVRRAVLEKVNSERRDRRRPPLASDARLDRVAEAHAVDMLKRAYYAHASPEGVHVRGRVEATGYRARRLGENLAKGLFTPEEVVERWMRSSPHRKNLLNPAYREIGIGCAFGENERGFEVLWVQVFADPG